MLIFTRDDHEEVLLAGGALGQVLHDVPVALNQVLHLIRLPVPLLFLLLTCLFLIIILTAVFLTVLTAPLLCFDSALMATTRQYQFHAHTHNNLWCEVTLNSISDPEVQQC